MKKILVFGNPDLEMDSLPLRILPKLKKEFPDIDFEVRDPNEELFDGDVYTGVITIVDTVLGIKDIEVFDNLEKFASAPNVSMHDFDALANLRFLQKLGKIDRVEIIGVPPGMNKKEAIKKISALLLKK